jgi:serine/threonine protein kinase
MHSEKSPSEFPQDWKQLWETFHYAREANPSERAAYLKTLSEADQKLSFAVIELLAAEQDSAEVLENLVIQELNLLSDPIQPETPDIETQELLSGRFRILRLLGKGGMGTVYEAFDEELGTSVALKVMRTDLALDSSARDRFHREINLARQITHPNTCRIFDLFRHNDLLFLTMEILHGETLHQKIQREGRISPSEAIPILLQVSDALGAIHGAGIVHRDLKSSNIILVTQEHRFRVVVTDFGLAITLPGKGSLHVTQTGQVLGTPEFMAPEQLTKGSITPATDVYAFGLVMYETLTSELPLAGESALTIAARRISEDAPSPRSLVPDLERKLERTISRCLERDPKHRFQNAAEVSAALTGSSFSFPLPVLTRAHQTRLVFRTLLVLGFVLAVFLWQWTRRESAPRSLSDVVAKRLWSSGTGLPPGVLSTDGKILIDVDWQSADLMSIDLANGKKRHLTNSGVWFVPHDFSPYPQTTCLAPDGKQVAYSEKHVWDPGCDVRSVSVEGSASRSLYSDKAACADPTDWSTDGKQILALWHAADGSAKIALISSQTGAIHFAKSLDSSDIRKMMFSPDGNFIVYDHPQQKDSKSHDVFVLSLKDGSETRIVAHDANDYLLGWSSDGEKIVFASDRSGTHDAWMLRLINGKPGGVPERARKDIGQIFPLKLTSYGSFYYAHLLTSSDVYTATLNANQNGPSSPPLKIGQGISGSNKGPAFSPDGKYLMVQTVRNPLETRWSFSPPTVLKMFSLITNEERDFPHQLKYTGGKTRWSPDGKWILIWGNDGISGPGLYRVSAETGKSFNIVRDPGNSFVRDYDWLDSNSVFYLMNKGGTLRLKDVAMGTERKIFSGVATFCVSPNKDRLALTNIDIHKGITSLKIVSVDGTQSQEILRLQMPEYIPALAWLLERDVIFAKGRRDLIDQPQGLWKISAYGGKSQELGIVTEYVTDISVHPDGRRLAIWTILDTSEVWVMENFLPPSKT